MLFLMSGIFFAISAFCYVLCIFDFCFGKITSWKNQTHYSGYTSFGVASWEIAMLFAVCGVLLFALGKMF